MDQSMVARFKKAAERQNEILSGGNISEQNERKKRLSDAMLDAKWAKEAEQEGKMNMQRDLLANNLDVARENNAGALARQQLQGDYGLKQEGIRGDFNLKAANIQSGTARDVAILNALNQRKGEAGKTEDDRFTALMSEVIKGNPGMKEEEYANAAKMIGGMLGGGTGGQGINAGNEGPGTNYRDYEIKPASQASPAPEVQPVQPRLAPVTQPAVKKEEPESLSLMGKRGLGLLNTKAEIEAQKPRNQATWDAEKKKAEDFYSEENKKKRREKVFNRGFSIFPNR